MSVNGVKEIQRAFKVRKRAHAKGLRRGLLKAGLLLQRESQKVVPVDTGTLYRSAKTRPEGVGFKTAVIVSYGTDYVLYVHEITDLKHAPGKQAKFLEGPLRRLRSHLGAIIVEEIEKEPI